jgi:hypothetical protein
MRLGLVGANSDARLRADCYAWLPDVTLDGVVADVPHRFTRETTEAQRAVEAGDIGTPTTVRTTRRVPSPHAADSRRPGDRDRFVERVRCGRTLRGDAR